MFVPTWIRVFVREAREVVPGPLHPLPLIGALSRAFPEARHQPRSYPWVNTVLGFVVAMIVLDDLYRYE